MTSLKFTMVPHSSYSPDLALSDFWLFPKLKETLKGQHFSLDAKVEAAVHKWQQPTRNFLHGQNEKMDRMIEKNCVAVNGDYVEK